MEIIQATIILFMIIIGAFSVGYELGKFIATESSNEVIDMYRKRIKKVNSK